MKKEYIYICNSLYMEFVSELAHKFIINENKNKYIREAEEGTEYTTEGQILFNQYYNDICKRLQNINIYPNYRQI